MGEEKRAGVVDGTVDGILLGDGTEPAVAENGGDAILFDVKAKDTVGAGEGEEQCVGFAIEDETARLFDGDAARTVDGSRRGSTSAGADPGCDVRGDINTADVAVA